MSTTIIGRIDDMGGRIDELEKSISDLMQQVYFSFESPESLFSLINFICFSLIILQAGIDAKGSLDGEEDNK